MQGCQKICTGMLSHDDTHPPGKDKGSVDVWTVDALAWAVASTEAGCAAAQDLRTSIPRLPRAARRAVVILRATGAIPPGARCACFEGPSLRFLSPSAEQGVCGEARGDWVPPRLPFLPVALSA